MSLKESLGFKEYFKKEDDVGAFLSKRESSDVIPIAVKDNIMVKGLPCTAGSKILENYIAPYDATVVLRLKKAGFGVLGKTSMDEFAMGSSTENSAFKPSLNPCDKERVPGGSSGGSAAAVAAGLAPVALGSDTGGSIRQPASFCGIVGLKPTYGSVSRYGLIATASSLDQIGVLSNNVSDSREIFDIIKGRDRKDSTSVKLSKISVPSKPVLGIPKQYFKKGLDSGVERVIKSAVKDLKKSGFKIKKVSLPTTKYALATYYLIMFAEASSNLARFDSIRYGGKRDEFGDEVKRRVLLGAYILSSGYYDAYYLQAQKVRSLITSDFLKVFKKVDLLLSPVAPTVAFKLGEKVEDPLSMYLSDIYTVPVNLAGLPAMSIPCGWSEGMPVGLQVIGRHFEEELLFKASDEFERIFRKR